LRRRELTDVDAEDRGGHAMGRASPALSEDRLPGGGYGVLLRLEVRRLRSGQRRPGGFEIILGRRDVFGVLSLRARVGGRDRVGRARSGGSPDLAVAICGYGRIVLQNEILIRDRFGVPKTPLYPLVAWGPRRSRAARA
jgi:hypothetical protein